MGKYEEITLEVGFWDQEGLNSYNEIDIIGRLVAELETCCRYTSDGHEIVTEWRIYQTADGRYAVWWLDRVLRNGKPLVYGLSDYTILTNIPEAGVSLKGIEFGFSSETVPGRLIDDAHSKKTPPSPAFHDFVVCLLKAREIKEALGYDYSSR